MNTHDRLRYFLTNTIFLLQVMYRYVRMIFLVKCVTITLFSFLMQRLGWKSMIFIALSSLETVYDTVQYRYCIFSLLNRLLWSRGSVLAFTTQVRGFKPGRIFRAKKSSARLPSEGK